MWVAGNHEFLQSIDKQIAKYRAACENNDRIHSQEVENEGYHLYLENRERVDRVIEETREFNAQWYWQIN
ncbi:MAG: hypothetical protein V3T17_04250 [Pseudomonadales bacterium]